MSDLMSQPGQPRQQPQLPGPGAWGLTYGDVLLFYSRERAKKVKHTDAVSHFAARFMVDYELAETWIRDARKGPESQAQRKAEGPSRPDVQQAGAGEGVLPQVSED